MTAGSVTALPGAARRLTSRSPVRDDAFTTVRADGVPGDRVYLIFSLHPALGTTSALFTGPLLLQAPLVSSFAGTLGASGFVVQHVGATDLGPLVEGLSLYLQAFFWNPGLHERAFSSPSRVLLLDTSF